MQINVAAYFLIFLRLKIMCRANGNYEAKLKF